MSSSICTIALKITTLTTKEMTNLNIHIETKTFATSTFHNFIEIALNFRFLTWFWGSKCTLLLKFAIGFKTLKFPFPPSTKWQLQTFTEARRHLRPKRLIMS